MQHAWTYIGHIMCNHADPETLTSVSCRHTGSAQGVEAHRGIRSCVLCLLLKSWTRGALTPRYVWQG